MRYAIVSDIHANLPAWNAVLADLARCRAERVICLGDTVGYGPEPAEVLASLYRRVDAFCLGNHDAVLAGKLDGTRFQARARRTLEWTAARVGPRAVEFLGSQPLVLTGPGFRCTHGEFGAPAAFRYVLEAADAVPSWQATSEPLLFVGHGHVPALCLLGASGTPHRVAPQDFVIEQGKRYLVCVGSVGHPRDGDPRAAYCLFESETRTVRWRRVPFDLDACRAALAAAGFDPSVAPYLDADPLRARPPVREMLSFAPSESPEQQARGVAASADLTRLRRRLGRWRALAATALVAALAGTAWAVWLLSREPPPAWRWHPSEPLPVTVTGTAGNALPPLPETAAADGRLPGWRWGPAQAEPTWSLAEQGPDGRPALTATLPRKARLRIEAAAMRVDGAAPAKVRVEAFVRRGEGFAGGIECVVDLVDRDAAGHAWQRPRWLHKPPTIHRRLDGWEQVQATSAEVLPGTAETIQFAIEGEFAGRVELAGLHLSLVPAARGARAGQSRGSLGTAVVQEGRSPEP